MYAGVSAAFYMLDGPEAKGAFWKRDGRKNLEFSQTCEYFSVFRESLNGFFLFSALRMQGLNAMVTKMTEMMRTTMTMMLSMTKMTTMTRKMAKMKH